MLRRGFIALPGAVLANTAFAQTRSPGQVSRAVMDFGLESVFTVVRAAKAKQVRLMEMRQLSAAIRLVTGHLKEVGLAAVVENAFRNRAGRSFTAEELARLGELLGTAKLGVAQEEVVKYFGRLPNPATLEKLGGLEGLGKEASLWANWIGIQIEKKRGLQPASFQDSTVCFDTSSGYALAVPCNNSQDAFEDKKVRVHLLRKLLRLAAVGGADERGVQDS